MAKTEDKSTHANTAGKSTKAEDKPYTRDDRHNRFDHTVATNYKNDETTHGRAQDVIETPGSRVDADKRPASETTVTQQDELALRLYIAYGAALGYRNLKNEALNAWEDLHKNEQDAWRNAAFAALNGGPTSMSREDIEARDARYAKNPPTGSSLQPNAAVTDTTTTDSTVKSPADPAATSTSATSSGTTTGAHYGETPEKSDK